MNSLRACFKGTILNICTDVSFLVPQKCCMFRFPSTRRNAMRIVYIYVVDIAELGLAVDPLRYKKRLARRTSGRLSSFFLEVSGLTSK